MAKFRLFRNLSVTTALPSLSRMAPTLIHLNHHLPAMNSDRLQSAGASLTLPPLLSGGPYKISGRRATAPDRLSRALD